MTNLSTFKLLLVFLFFVNGIIAQTFEADADVRARFEYRHGFNDLFSDNADPAAFVQQRTRLNLGYTAEKLKLFIAVQDVSTWGDTRQILPVDGNDSFSLFQAYALLNFNENWSTKVGRQSIAYDNERIFGGLDWAMQGRFHDAAILKYQKDGFNLDLGAAFSQEKPKNEGNTYRISGFFTYKTMQYAYLNKFWDNSSVSFLFLNNGFQGFSGPENITPDGVYHRQTMGSYFKFPIQNVNMAGTAYYQFGKANNTTDLSAYQLSLEVTYKPGSTLFGLGMEMLSGTNQEGESKNRSFFPLYGTNHKFNGFMDYFYVGNHANNAGLNDIYAKAILNTGEKSNLLLKVHYFMANAELQNNADNYLGTEIDLVYSNNLMKYVKMNIGYSHMLASDSMSLVKGGKPSDNTNNWAWVQLNVNPKLFSLDFKK
ncbi:Alginate export [Salegentibacter holothuriorum]|uniref:Alginate export n=1 Tax=Salegentibacter holothuriorum TaxID=241145 RepID=A0A1T5BQ91_9FLAO|nr:alginate export family protein [Salegentibacter holothuriorum]SKB49093.1 Alginate export [Salegentibacter holothuriorum]